MFANRKLRNRLSQRAFRQRQILRIHELEQRLDTSTEPESERNARLIRENQSLRNQLVECRRQLELIHTNLGHLVQGIQGKLGPETNGDSQAGALPESPPSSDGSTSAANPVTECEPDAL